jgi:hypothetical protein
MAKPMKDMTPAELEAKAGFNRAKMVALRDREQAEMEQSVVGLIPKFKKASILLASTHGSYNLREEPVFWTVPNNTYIFETQNIGDTTLTAIDDPVWRLCQSASRAYFINYFIGNNDFFKLPGKGDAQEQYSKIFKNFLFYRPGDSIAIRDLSIGGGNEKEPDGSDRNSFVNMGFYKFNMVPRMTPSEDPPLANKERRVGSEILHAMRTKMVYDEDFKITNKQFVDLTTKGTAIEYAGKYNSEKPQHRRTQLQAPEIYRFDVEGEKYRIFIFSSCAAINCNKLKDATGKLIEKPYESELCNARIRKIESIQALQSLKVMAMGINSMPGGSGDLGFTHRKLVEAKNLRMTKARKQKAEGQFALNSGEEEYAELNSDVADWWKLGALAAEEPKIPAKQKPFTSVEARNAAASAGKGGSKTQRKNRLRRKKQTRKYQ